MATINIDKFDDELYGALLRRAEDKKSSIAAVVAELVRQHIPTESELLARRSYFERLKKIHEKPVPEGVALKSTEELLREGRER